MPLLFPPHPKFKILSHELNRYEKSEDWVCQRKFNGTNIVIYVSENRDISIFTRHGTAPKRFSLTKNHIQQINSLKLEKGKDYWLNAELLDHKTKDECYKEKIILFDLLHAGEYLTRKYSQIKRLEMLSEVCGNPKNIEPNKGIALEVTQNIWLAETWENDFQKHFEEFLKIDEIEGLILRKRKSFIDNFGQKEYDVDWIVRCRKPHAGGGYNF